jgi:pilus assembly protein FimV
MRRASLTLTFGAALTLLGPADAIALGFGRTVTATNLGQPLNFAASVALDPDETLARECVGADVMIGDAKVARDNVRVTLETVGASGERRVRVTTRTIVDEPIVTINVVIGCHSQVSRRFVAFVDPPLVNLASAQEALPPQEIGNQVGPLLDIVRGADASRRRAPGGDAGGSLAPAEPHRTGRHSGAATRVATASSSPRQATPRAAPTRNVASAATTPAAPSRSMPRLRLDPPATPPAARPTLATAAAAAVASDAGQAQLLAAEAAASAAGSELVHERERRQALDAELAKVRGDAQAQQKTLGALQARLRQAEDDRYTNGLVYTLAAALLLFVLLAAALWALRPRQRRRARWFDANASAPRRAAPGASAAAPATDTMHAPKVSQHPSQWHEGPASILPVTAPASIGGLEVTTVLAPQSHFARMAEAGASANAPAGRTTSPSMEELIDLEQQAEFYVVLGQEEAAIALLAAHLREAFGASPLPYLQLLEIHQRRQDRASYEEVRQAFQRRFNALAPEWSAELHCGRSLEEHPQAIARLQALWPTPLHAMRSLDGLLFRRDEGDETFDFPAYRELLFLYSIARELAGNVETDSGSIDLFLPLEDAPTEPNLRPDGIYAVDLDVSSWPEDTPTDELAVRRSAGRRSAG